MIIWIVFAWLMFFIGLGAGIWVGLEIGKAKL